MEEEEGEKENAEPTAAAEANATTPACAAARCGSCRLSRSPLAPHLSFGMLSPTECIFSPSRRSDGAAAAAALLSPKRPEEVPEFATLLEEAAAEAACDGEEGPCEVVDIDGVPVCKSHYSRFQRLLDVAMRRGPSRGSLISDFAAHMSVAKSLEDLVGANQAAAVMAAGGRQAWMCQSGMTAADIGARTRDCESVKRRGSTVVEIVSPVQTLTTLVCTRRAGLADPLARQPGAQGGRAPRQGRRPCRGGSQGLARHRRRPPGRSGGGGSGVVLAAGAARLKLLLLTHCSHQSMKQTRAITRKFS